MNYHDGPSYLAIAASLAALVHAQPVDIRSIPAELLGDGGRTVLSYSSAIVSNGLGTVMHAEIEVNQNIDYILESPNYVPSELAEFASRGYERKNRWA